MAREQDGGRLTMEMPPPPLHHRPPATSRCGADSACPGTLTIGFVAVGRLNANQDVLVQQVLGVRDDGLQLHREGHTVRAARSGTSGGRLPAQMRGVPEQTGLQVFLLTTFEFLFFMSKTVGRNHTSTLSSTRGSLLSLSPHQSYCTPGEIWTPSVPHVPTSLPSFPLPCIPQHHGGGGRTDKKVAMGPGTGSKCTPLPTPGFPLAGGIAGGIAGGTKACPPSGQDLRAEESPGVSCRLLEGGSANDKHISRAPALPRSSCCSEGLLAPSCPAGPAQGTFVSGSAPHQCRAAPVQAQGGAVCVH